LADAAADGLAALPRHAGRGHLPGARRYEARFLARDIDVEVDAEKRLALVRQNETLMEQNPPLLPIAWEEINDVWYAYVKGLNPASYFGCYDVVRQDTVWLDKA